ncbi:MAG: rhodanese-like domain-containing protein [Desulfuromonadaceae bacterium]|nr:rhodanese-like domain-containing protein [Desulfuromonadaceae bacterium]
MQALDAVLERMTLDFVGNGRHKMTIEKLLSAEEPVLLDVRTLPETETVTLAFRHQLTSLVISLHELPQRWREVPQTATVGIFCPHSVRAAIAYTYLRAQGVESVFVLDGGYAAVCEWARPGAVLPFLKG